MRIISNPDREFFNDMKREVKGNNGYCPNAKVKSKDTRCICKAFKDQFEAGELGACECCMYIIVDDE